MNILKKILCILTIILSCVCTLYSQDKSQYTLSSTVEFVVNTNNFVYNEKYNTFINETVNFINENVDNIENILLIGCASPEGNKEWNKHLAKIRAEKIYSYFKDVIPIYKINVINDYDLFIKKTGLTDKDWKELRATYIEIHLKKHELVNKADTIYIKETFRDTIYITERFRDTIYIKQKPDIIPILAIKTNTLSDILATPNVQAELYTWLWGVSLEFDYTFPW